MMKIVHKRIIFLILGVSAREINTINEDGTHGLLFVWHNEQWSTICDRRFSIENANVACRSMGFTNALQFFDLGRSSEGPTILVAQVIWIRIHT